MLNFVHIREKSIFLCIIMDLSLSDSQSQLAPVGGKLEKDYFKVTFGRVYGTMALLRRRLNVLVSDWFNYEN